MRHSVLVSSLVLVLAGCIHGQDGSRLPSTSPSPPDSASEEQRRREYAAHPEFRNQYGLSQVKAHYAYARGATGEGVTLGIVDSGVDPSHPKFEGKLEISNVEGYEPDFSTCDNPAFDGSCPSILGHGTFVAGIMAGSRGVHPDGNAGSLPASASASAVHGVAFDAEVISVGFPSLDEVIEEVLPENPTPEQIQELPDLILGIESMLESQFASAFKRLNGRVTAVNASFGLPGNIEEFGAEELRGRFPNVIEAIAQEGTPAGERTVYVWAAGNARGEINLDGSVESGSSVEIVAGLPVRIPKLRGHSLAVVATDEQGTIAEFSNRCGIAKDFCLAAPGVNITGPVPGFYCPAGTAACYLTFEEAGTSSAAPFVTGGIGLLAQQFRNQLGNDEIVERLLATADRTGMYADADVYGRGFLDLDAATRPVGEARMLTGHTLTGPSAPSVRSAIHLGVAFGDSLALGLAQREVASFDELDAPFFSPLGDHLRAGDFENFDLEERLRALGRDPRGAPWQVAGTRIRIRLDAVSTSRGAGGTVAPASLAETGIPGSAASTLPGSLGSLTLTRDVAKGRLLLGYRAHPGWQFGSHAGNSLVASDDEPIGLGTFMDDAAFANPYLGFARDGASIGYVMPAGPGSFRVAAFHGSAQFGERREADASRATGALTEYRFGASGLAMQAGWLVEAERLVGSRPSGAFGELGGNTGMAGLSTYRQLGNSWGLLASAHAGTSRAEVRRRGMMQNPSALWTSSFALGLIGNEIDQAGGRLAFRLSQPLRVEAGQAQLRWVSGRTTDGQVRIEHAAFDLEPSGRQLDLEVTYSRPWAGGRAHLAVIASRDAGHVDGRNDAALLMRFSRMF
ncbi:MAG: S8 family serine peptidase [Bryobacterales bacterium]|nr:S8 family serine peptidase [Bryobacterales bacterium]